eukprot:scaffold104610_cov70-Phaeocystis_antarctica.AAC.1
MPSRCARIADMQQRRTPRICGAFVGELHTDRSRGAPTLPTLDVLSRRLARKEISRRNNQGRLYRIGFSNTLTF